MATRLRLRENGEWSDTEIAWHDALLTEPGKTQEERQAQADDFAASLLEEIPPPVGERQFHMKHRGIVIEWFLDQNGQTRYAAQGESSDHDNEIDAYNSAVDVNEADVVAWLSAGQGITPQKIAKLAKYTHLRTIAAIRGEPLPRPQDM